MTIARRTPLTRRGLLKGAASLPLAAILANPLLARAVAATLAEVTLTTAGGKTVRAALALPARAPASAVLLVHEWWGLNDQIKSVAAELARRGYVALAVDLYDGHVATTAADARRFMATVARDPRTATETLAGWVAWLKADERGNGKIGTVGWCFGGGWSLNASIAAPVEATVIYYGDVRRKAGDLARLKGPVLGHFATRDRWITRQMVTGFAAEMKTAGKSLTTYWYDADHAFANPTQARYDAGDAKLAWARTLAFYRRTL